MDRIGNPNELLTQVNHFWNMLDDMADNSPESYQKFIQRHMKEGKDFMAPPEPHLCLQTKILDPEEKVLFINICSWSRVPAPQSEAHPVPLGAGRLDHLSEGAVTDIAYNPAVLNKAEKDPIESDQLIRLAMKYIEEKYKVTLCHAYRLAPFKLKGKVKRMRESLQGMEKQADIKTEDSTKVNDSLLEQLKSMAIKGEEQETNPSISLTKDETPRNGIAGLIEEISSTEIQEEGLLVSPKHDLCVMKDESGHPTMLTLKIDLENVHSVAECELSVSKDDLMFEVAGRYHLHLNLPQEVNEDTVKAQLHKEKHVLTVTMPVLKHLTAEQTTKASL
ncbi:PIH1 domain-containing protein 2 [Pelobates fuscus]|uniref:PIH1 domain-containing protein 2 n=1 Tax=Pelobates fuscus TaxID=191477 RepID=UPI002FE4F648